MHEGPEISTTPSVPAQRVPESDESTGAEAVAGARGVAGRGGRSRILLAGGAALGVLLAGLVIFRPGVSPKAAPSNRPAASASATPYDKAVATLNAQTAAMVSGDEDGWLAAVDTGLKARYRSLYRNLRGLGVTSVHYGTSAGRPVKGDRSALSMRVGLFYCFGDDMCPKYTNYREPLPHISQVLTLKPVGGKYVITALGVEPQPGYDEPLPWESGDLTFAQGKRVVVAAGAGEQKYLETVLPVAERAASVADHYAALNGAPQKRYRIFLASEKQWKSWYGGTKDNWWIGLTVPLDKRGLDVMIRMAEMDDPLTLATTVQHELGHVVTLTGAFDGAAEEYRWVSEGVAEYIGWRPKSAAQSWRRDSVRRSLKGGAPKSMVPVEPGPDAPDRALDTFYGLSHLAVDCMAKKYGEAKMFTFVKLLLTQSDNDLDKAARAAYGLPFGTVDHACAAWIKTQV